MTVEKQFKERHIQFKHVTVASDTLPPALTATQSILARSIPALCVESQHILSGAPAAEAAMPNIRVIPLNWWSDTRAPRVVTCVKLKYVQQPLGRRAGGTSAVIRPSKRIIYDTTHAVVSFLSEDVSKCVDEFLEEWARVSKMVVIAREGEWRFRGDGEVCEADEASDLQSRACRRRRIGQMSDYYRSICKRSSSRMHR